MASIFRQCFFLARPPLTQQNLPDQTGRVHIVTGGYSGCGLQLSRILYQKHATIYIAGRSPDKARSAIDSIKRDFPESLGRLEFLQLDLSDPSSIKASAEEFMSKESRLDVLTNNAGVMVTKANQQDAEGHEIHFGTNCLGPFLFSELVLPVLVRTAAGSSPGSVRVTWASSLATMFAAPAHGIEFDDNGSPRDQGPFVNYGASKAGNWFLASEFARRYGEHGILSLAWNPGNVRSDLQRDVDGFSGAFVRMLLSMLLFPTEFGAYTELYAGWSKDISLKDNGAYVCPWGRIGTDSLRADVLKAAELKDNGGTGEAEELWEWCDRETRKFR
ncbi:hypothetical protein BGZ61DRAFT_455587 [Ilyonectria robusta]|uniref:uncharacterized protein n=1 Tax=Ilyonectria robusta TaxID=1079257 RepID=UPI001E8E4CD0|nr:uncharacterized protein BGZ61DRAFT_455587 [Ilyonectria robusta]KAH8684063.1 hypothetical protein BGZ61DRAFT_455587 [Ilyonectria robusta]